MTTRKPTRVERAGALHDQVQKAVTGAAEEPFTVLFPVLAATGADRRDVAQVLVDALTGYEGGDVWGDDEAGAGLVLRQLVHVYTHRRSGCEQVTWGDIVEYLARDFAARTRIEKEKRPHVPGQSL